LEQKPKVIDSLWTFLVATAVAGPFALPLLWRNPRYSKRTKIIASVAVIAFTLFLIYGAGAFLDKLMKDLELRLQQMQEIQ